MTDIVPNQLYPGGVMKQLADAAGGVTYDQYAPGGCVRQLSDAAGVDTPLDQYAAGGPMRQIELEIEESEGGGGGEPDWVPDNAKIHIDLVRAFNEEDAAWTVADGVVAVDTLLGTDANTENGWSTTEYNSADLTTDGLVYSNDPPAMIGSARTLMVAGATAALKWKQSGTNTVQFFVGSTDGNDGLTVGTNGVNEEGACEIGASTYGGGALSVTISDIVNIAPGINGVAMTLVSNRFDLACNGSTPTTSVLDGTARPPGNPFSAVVAFQAAECALQSITLYDALPTTAGLSALSETGE